MPRSGILTTKQTSGLDTFVAGVLDAYKNGQISRLDAVLAIGHVIAAVDKGNETEIVQFPANWKPSRKD